jgi:hypothetical protein
MLNAEPNKKCLSMMLFSFIGYVVVGGLFLIILVLPFWYIGKHNAEKRKEIEKIKRMEFFSLLWKGYIEQNDSV